MKTLIIFLTTIISINSFGRMVKSKQLSKKTDSSYEGETYSYIQQEIVDLCFVSKLEEVVSFYDGKETIFCRIERSYGHLTKSDLFLENCDSIKSIAKICSPYL